MNTYLQNKNGEISSGKHLSCWFDLETEGLQFRPLTNNMETEVVIIGGGIAGLSIAYCLTQAGRSVALVEDGYLGSGETGRSTAQLVTALDDRYFELERIFGREGTARIGQSHAGAIDFIEKVIQREKIECDFERVNGYLFSHPSDSADTLKKEYDACKSAGLDISILPIAPYSKLNEGPCIRFHNQAQINPLKYLAGLAAAVIRKGGHIFTETHASEIDETGIQTAAGFQIKAKHVVIATNSPVNNKYAMHLKQSAYRTYVIAGRIKKNSIPKALWWDTGDKYVNPKTPPYHYVRIQTYDAESDLLICGGEDHPIGNTEREHIPEENRYQLLEEWARHRFEFGEVVYNWSGQVLEPIDALAFIGRNPWDKDNVYIVTGDSGNGMTHGTIAGSLITDLILGQKNKLESLYKPSRFSLKAGGTFFQELIGGLVAYLKQKPHHPEAVQLSAIERGKGQIIEIAKEKYGAYRDEANNLHIVAAECTHLNCILKWNNDEKSWDCPCHGSRFSYDGKMLNGPANRDLPLYRDQGLAENGNLGKVKHQN